MLPVSLHLHPCNEADIQSASLLSACIEGETISTKLKPAAALAALKQPSVCLSVCHALEAKFGWIQKIGLNWTGNQFFEWF